jgi:hypothetical protein
MHECLTLLVFHTCHQLPAWFASTVTALQGSASPRMGSSNFSLNAKGIFFFSDKKPTRRCSQPNARIIHNKRLKFVLLRSTSFMCTPIFSPRHIWTLGQSVLAGLVSRCPPRYPSSTGSFFFAPLISSGWPYSRR